MSIRIREHTKKGALQSECSLKNSVHKPLCIFSSFFLSFYYTSFVSLSLSIFLNFWNIQPSFCNLDVYLYCDIAFVKERERARKRSMILEKGRQQKTRSSWICIRNNSTPTKSCFLSFFFRFLLPSFDCVRSRKKYKKIATNKYKFAMLTLLTFVERIYILARPDWWGVQIKKGFLRLFSLSPSQESRKWKEKEKKENNCIVSVTDKSFCKKNILYKDKKNMKRERERKEKEWECKKNSFKVVKKKLFAWVVWCLRKYEEGKEKKFMVLWGRNDEKMG